MASSAWVRACIPIVPLAFLLLGCKREEITTSAVPKDAPSATPPPTASAAVPGGPAPMRWTTPAGWQEQPASGMRVGSFTVTKDGQKADVSIIPLAGISGSEVDNVNRWRGQLGLPPIDAAKLGDAAEKVTIGSNPASLYDMSGTDPQTKQPARILASILSSDGTTWFFKMVGADALVAQEKPSFKEFLKSISGQAAPVAAGAPAQDQLPPSHPPINLASSAQPMSAAPNPDKPAWDVPAGWQEQAPSSMRLAHSR